MAGVALLPIMLVGLAGSVHCVGMCGGIVSAFSAAPRVFPVAVVTLGSGAADSALRVLAYNSGRIASYAVAGGLAAGAADGAASLAGLSGLQAGGYWLANLMLVALGLYLMDAWRGVAQLELLGKRLWARLRPLASALLPFDSPLKMLVAGAVWGWLPCGMVYSVLLTAMFAGSAGEGALVMLAFGLGTLPMMLAMGMAGQALRQALQGRAVRTGAGLLVLGFGLLGLVRAASAHSPWLDALCRSGGLA